MYAGGCGLHVCSYNRGVKKNLKPVRTVSDTDAGEMLGWRGNNVFPHFQNPPPCAESPPYRRQVFSFAYNFGQPIILDMQTQKTAWKQRKSHVVVYALFSRLVWMRHASICKQVSKQASNAQRISIHCLCHDLERYYAHPFVL